MLKTLSGRVIGVVGWKDSGKTTVVESMVSLLNAKGFTVGTVKHIHGELSLQPDAKDSARHLDAGAETSAVAGDGVVVLERRGDGDLETVAARYLSLCDVIVVEGFKHAEIPKVAVLSETDDILEDASNVVAVVYRKAKPEAFPAFKADDIQGLVDFLLENEVLKTSGAMATLMVNGRPVPINEFVQASLAGVLRGFIAALHDVEPPETIQLTINQRCSGG